MSGSGEELVDARYSHHWRLPELGRTGQERLLSARILIVGCGALGALSLIHISEPTRPY